MPHTAVEIRLLTGEVRASGTPSDCLRALEIDEPAVTTQTAVEVTLSDRVMRRRGRFTQIDRAATWLDHQILHRH